MKNINIILAILAFVGIALHVIGNILNDESYWILTDIYAGVVFALLAYRLLVLRKKFSTKNTLTKIQLEKITKHTKTTHFKNSCIAIEHLQFLQKEKKN